MSKNESSSLSIWDDVSEKLESLREALNTHIDESDSSGKSSEESDLLYHYTESDAVSLGTFDIVTLRKVLNTPIDETIASDKPSEESNLPSQNDDHDATDLGSSDNKNIVLEEAESSNVPEILTETVDEPDTNDEPVSEGITVPKSQIKKTYEPDKLDDKQQSRDVEIKVNTEQSIKNEKITNYWKQSETPNPYILKVDESREKLNRSLEMARELVNRQSEETPKQEKKRFPFRFVREPKNGNHNSNTVKEQEKRSKKSIELKPMVYEMLEPKPDSQDNQGNQGKHEQRVKETTKKLDDRAKSSQEKEIINHRNRLEKRRSLGVPVFVKKPVNLEQIRQLKSMLINQNNLNILVDTGSSQGRLLVISGQDPDTLLNTLSQLSIVKNITIEDETINLVIQT